MSPGEREAPYLSSSKYRVKYVQCLSFNQLRIIRQVIQTTLMPPRLRPQLNLIRHAFDTGKGDQAHNRPFTSIDDVVRLCWMALQKTLT